MATGTYTRTYTAEVTETISLNDADLSDDERSLLDGLNAGETIRTDLVDEVLCRFDADHEEITHLDSHALSIARID